MATPVQRCGRLSESTGHGSRCNCSKTVVNANSHSCNGIKNLSIKHYMIQVEFSRDHSRLMMLLLVRSCADARRLIWKLCTDADPQNILDLLRCVLFGSTEYIRFGHFRKAQFMDVGLKLLLFIVMQELSLNVISYNI